MIHLTATRFTNDTWKQNCDYREKRKIKGCIYGVPKRNGALIPVNGVMFVFEMNNEVNRIMGIGLIKNYLRVDKRYNIYRDGNYNRYTYKSDIRVDREELTDSEEETIKMVEKIVFYGCGHIKRGQGITKIPESRIHKDKKKIIQNTIKIFLQRFKTLDY